MISSKRTACSGNPRAMSVSSWVRSGPEVAEEDAAVEGAGGGTVADGFASEEALAEGWKLEDGSSYHTYKN